MTSPVGQGIFTYSRSLCHFMGIVSGTHDAPVAELPLKDGNLPVCLDGCYRILTEKIRETGKSVLWGKYTSRELVHILKRNERENPSSAPTADDVGDRCYYTETVEGEHDSALIEVHLQDGSFSICKRRCYKRFRVKVSGGNKPRGNDGAPLVDWGEFTSDGVLATLQSIGPHKKRKKEEEKPATAETSSSDLIAKSDEKKDELDTGTFLNDLVKDLEGDLGGLIGSREDGSIFVGNSSMIRGVHSPQSPGISDEKNDDLEIGDFLNDLIKDLE